MSAPRRPVVLASNLTFGLGLLLLVIGLVTGPRALVVVGVFVLAVAVGLALANRSQRRARDHG